MRKRGAFVQSRAAEPLPLDKTFEQFFTGDFGR